MAKSRTSGAVKSLISKKNVISGVKEKTGFDLSPYVVSEKGFNSRSNNGTVVDTSKMGFSDRISYRKAYAKGAFDTTKIGDNLEVVSLRKNLKYRTIK